MHEFSSELLLAGASCWFLVGNWKQLKQEPENGETEVNFIILLGHVHGA